VKLSRLYKRLSRALIFIAAVSLVLGTGTAILWIVKRPSEEDVRQVVKHFTFQTPEDLEKLDSKLLGGNWTSYTLSEADGKKCIKATSDKSASTLVYEQELFYSRNPFVSWEWKAGAFPVRQEEETLARKKDFDFVAQFYVIFSSKFFLNAKAIQYVWTESVPVGTTEPSPYTSNVKILVLESGPSEGWKHEERDIRKDFEELFGEELDKDIAAIALMTDSDSTGTSAEAYWGDITLGYLGRGKDAAEKDKEKTKKKKWVRSKRFPFLKEYAD
jgi:hypothetical protein